MLVLLLFVFFSFTVCDRDYPNYKIWFLDRYCKTYAGVSVMQPQIQPGQCVEGDDDKYYYKISCSGNQIIQEQFEDTKCKRFVGWVNRTFSTDCEAWQGGYYQNFCELPDGVNLTKDEDDFVQFQSYTSNKGCLDVGDVVYWIKDYCSDLIAFDGSSESFSCSKYYLERTKYITGCPYGGSYEALINYYKLDTCIQIGYNYYSVINCPPSPVKTSWTTIIIVVVAILVVIIILISVIAYAINHYRLKRKNRLHAEYNEIPNDTVTDNPINTYKETRVVFKSENNYGTSKTQPVNSETKSDVQYQLPL